MAHKRNEKDMKKEIEDLHARLQDMDSVLHAVGRFERIIQNYEKNLSKLNMDLLIMQEYATSLGGTEEGFVQLRNKRLAEAQAQVEKEIQATLEKQGAPAQSNIVGLDGKPIQPMPKPPEPPKDETPEPERTEE